MPNVLDIRRRIRSVRNTRQITKAMKMVSSAKLRRAQERALAARPFSQMLTNVLKSLVSRAEIYDPVTGEAKHPLLARREEKTALLILVTGDKGLAGAFNSNLLKTTQRYLANLEGKNVDIEVIGRKGRDFLRRRYPVGVPSQERKGPVQIVGEYVGVLGKMSIEEVTELSERIIDRYSRGEIDSVYLVYNEFKSVISQRMVVETVLPITSIGSHEVKLAEEPKPEEREHAAEVVAAAGIPPEGPDVSEIDAQAAKFPAPGVDYIYEQPAEELFGALLPKYIVIQIYQALLESWAAFNAAQMTAMDSATNNASDLIDSLTLAMNRARQAAITKEIIEIVSGAAAL